MASDRSGLALLLLGVALALPAPAASARPKQEPRDTWGEATRQTLSAQIIDPNPQYETAVPTTSGQQVAAAVDRYRNDKVKKPDKVSSSSVGRQASGGASGN